MTTIIKDHSAGYWTERRLFVCDGEGAREFSIDVFGPFEFEKAQEGLARFGWNMPSLQELVLLLGILYDCSCGARDHDLDVFRNVLESRKGGLWTSTALRRCESNDEDTMCYPIVYARDNTASEFGILRDMGHAELVRDLRTKVRGYYTRGHKERELTGRLTRSELYSHGFVDVLFGDRVDKFRQLMSCIGTSFEFDQPTSNPRMVSIRCSFMSSKPRIDLNYPLTGQDAPKRYAVGIRDQQ